MIQNQHLQPEDVPASNVNLVHAAGQLDLESSTEIDATPRLQNVEIGAHQPPMEESNLLAAQEMETAEHETLLDNLIGQARKRNRWRRVSSGFFYSGLLLFLICRIPDLFGYTHFILSDFSAVLALVYGSAAVGEGVNRQRWGKSLASLANIDDVRAVGALAEAMDVPDKDIRTQAQAALTRLLPRLQSEDSHLLNEAQRNCLYRRLKIEYALTTADFMVTLLESLAKIGDAGALPAVQDLAVSTVTSANGRRVQEAARKCLPVLRLRIQTQETSSTLVRASSAEDVAGASLLRPAHGGEDTAPEQLLRASGSDEG